MRKIVILGAVFAFGLTSTAFGGAKDKASNTLLDRNAAGVINNVTVKTSVKSKGCTIQVQAKPANLADGEIVICILEADLLSPVPGGNSLIITGEGKKQSLKIKANIGETKIAGQGCGDAEAMSYNGQIKCYLDDPVYRQDAVGPGTWRQACADAGMLLQGTVGTTQLKGNPGVPVVVGLCQGLGLGQRIVPPASTEWALTGQRNAPN